eukprot:CAMPEP_0114439430 /NCGR_PEP_ID=MMETSP0103-20121206/15191_1 /TAXON_ID=37642 ORGANISM="Paraphysomonas imperforata, Strain PA2" /NCGR_SAMPLE_ID=MMETSP0103 /ASSEMBLY_ACC=CAM_ASM_000201 /LENGTH=377 /DNA_ID=CAMNT_0001610185 /DNA_START=145 /DNA_END=1280 /DNA_ORIENTATION=-
MRRSVVYSSRSYMPQLHRSLHNTTVTTTGRAGSTAPLAPQSVSLTSFLPAFRASLAPSLPSWATRTVTGALLAAVWTPLCFSGKPVFGMALALPLVLAVREFQLLLTRTAGLCSDDVGVVAAPASAMLLATHAAHLHAFSLPLSVSALMFQVLFLEKGVTSSGAIIAAAFSTTFISFFMSFWIRVLDIKVVNFVNVPSKMGPLAVTNGALLLWWTQLVIASADIGGYVFGKLLGRHPVAELGVAAGEVSPRKTLEGVLGGVVLAVASASAGVLLFKPELPWQVEGFTSHMGLGHKFAVLYGTSMALLSFVSDVSVSLFKRNAGVKDTGQVLPGHGGVLDRMDSYLLTAPAVYMFWTLAADTLNQSCSGLTHLISAII